jgi:hypothetical protein
MEVIDHISGVKGIHIGNLMKKKRMEIATQRYAQFDLCQCNKSFWFFFSPRLVDIRPRSPSPLPLPLSPSVDIVPEYLFNSSLSPPSNSQSLSLYLGENSKSLFRNSVSTRDSLKSTTSERAVLMYGSEQSSVVQPLLTDLYQISMAYAYWKSNKHEEISTFDLYFRKNRMLIKIEFNIYLFLLICLAFGGEYTLFAGLEECLKFIRDYKFHPTDIEYLRASLPTYIESEFYDYLSTLNMNDVKVYAVPEGKKYKKKILKRKKESKFIQVLLFFRVYH